MYLHLFRAVTKALSCLQAQRYSDAEQCLIRAQQKTESLYMESDV